MAHLIESMMYVNSEGVPWHGLGKPLAAVATAEEAIVASGQDWTVSTRPVYTTINGQMQEIKTSRAIVRDTDNRIYCVLSDKYVPLQNTQSFDFLDDLVGKGKAIYHTAGSLDGGKRVWLLAKLPDNIVVLGKDVTEQYLLVCNSHDGTLAVKVLFTPVRVVCNNTLTAALNGRYNAVSIRHVGSLQAKFAAAARTLGIAQKYFADLQLVMQGLTTKMVDADLVKLFGEKLFCYPEKPEDLEKTEQWEILRASQTHRRRILSELVEAGKGTEIPGVKGSMYGVYQASVELYDHYYKDYRSGDQRMKDTFFGTLPALKQESLALAMSLS